MHAVEHLRGDDYRLVKILALGDDALLLQWHLRHVNLDTQVTSRDHDAVGLGHDFVESIQRFTLFDLRDDARPRTAGADDVFERADFVGRTHEAEAYEIDARFRCPNRMLMVVDADCRCAQMHAWQVDALTATNRALLDDAELGATGRQFFDRHAHSPIG